LRAAVRAPVAAGGNDEGVGLRDRLSQELDESVVDACVLDAGGCEKKFHVPPGSRRCVRVAVETGRRPETHRFQLPLTYAEMRIQCRAWLALPRRSMSSTRSVRSAAARSSTR